MNRIITFIKHLSVDAAVVVAVVVLVAAGVGASAVVAALADIIGGP
jgi:hypothetical protein